VFALLATGLVATTLATLAGAQDPGSVEALLGDPTVRTALEAAREGEARTLADQVRLCEIPAPPFGEAARAAALRDSFEAVGLSRARIDAAGNVIAERPGLGDRPRVVISAHLDTVFPEGTDVGVRRDGSRLHGPGIGDDCRGLAVLLGTARALGAAQVSTPGTLVFVGTVGEEGLGNLRGVRHLFEAGSAGPIDRFVSLDGAGSGLVHAGVGSHRYRVVFRGPGGHSYSAFGLPSPISALGRAVARLAAFEVPEEPRTTFNVGRIGGGTSVNSIAHEAWMEVDLRSEDPEALHALDARFRAAVDAAVQAEGERGKMPGSLSVELIDVGQRPAGATPVDDPIVVLALEAGAAVGLDVTVSPSSTDANLPMSRGVPAITIDGGGTAEGSHSLDEWFDSTESWRGTQWATLLAIALTQEY
jgi:acetylornithine deacetylase/succinyl-diaminopimelate desuccinylase-like protein